MHSVVIFFDTSVLFSFISNAENIHRINILNGRKAEKEFYLLHLPIILNYSIKKRFLYNSYYYHYTTINTYYSPLWDQVNVHFAAKSTDLTLTSVTDPGCLTQ